MGWFGLFNDPAKATFLTLCKPCSSKPNEPDKSVGVTNTFKFNSLTLIVELRSNLSASFEIIGNCLRTC